MPHALDYRARHSSERVNLADETQVFLVSARARMRPTKTMKYILSILSPSSRLPAAEKSLSFPGSRTPSWFGMRHREFRTVCRSITMETAPTITSPEHRKSLLDSVVLRRPLSSPTRYQSSRVSPMVPCGATHSPHSPRDNSRSSMGKTL